MIVEIILFIVLIYILYKQFSKPPDMPPGSYGLPIIGKLPPVNSTISDYVTKMKKQYGNIFTTKWGSRVVVFLADPHVIRRALSHPDVQGRPRNYSFQLFQWFQNAGVINSVDNVWKDNRRFLLHHLRDLGMGKTRLESSIIKEVEMLIKYLEEKALDEPIEMDLTINTAVINVIWLMLASKRYDVNDETITKYNNMVKDNIEIIQGPIFLIDTMPWLLNIMPIPLLNYLTNVNVMKSHMEHFYELFKETIMNHKETLDPNDPRDIIDHYLIERKDKIESADNMNEDGYLDLIVIMSDMFNAGSETTSTTLRWIILHLANDQKVQKKVHDALDAVVPKDQLPSLDDRDKLPYIDAVIFDVLRLSSLVSLGIPHAATADIQLEGYKIPKDTTIFPCLVLSHQDPSFWERPKELYPEHFLDENGKLNSKKDAFMPFSVGRRQCLGESLARMELYLFASAILHKFIIEAPPGVKLDTGTDPTKKILNQPKPFKVILRKRF